MRQALMRSALAAAGIAATALMIAPGHAGPVTTEDLVKAQDKAGEWLMYGRDYRNWRYNRDRAQVVTIHGSGLTS